MSEKNTDNTQAPPPRRVWPWPGRSEWGRILKRCLKVGAWTVGSIAVLLIVAALLLNCGPVQNWLMGRALTVLSDKLGTHVALEKVSIDLLTQDVCLHELAIDDLQGRQLLQAGELRADVDVRRLMDGEVRVTDAILTDVNARVVRSDSDSVANYQFLVDALKPGEEDTGGTKFTVDVDRVKVERVKVFYNADSLWLGKLDCRLHGTDLPTLRGEDLGYSWARVNRKGIMVDRSVAVGTIHLDDGKLDLDGVRFVTNNHRPRKNACKPHRGFFDVDHLDLTASLRMIIDHAAADSVHAVLEHLEARDTVTGIDLREVRCTVAATPRRVTATDIYVRQGDTEVNVGRGVFTLPDSETGAKLGYQTSTITVKAILKDISRPFAPILKGFTLPLYVSTVMSGDNDRINFANVVVNTSDKQFLLHAGGAVWGLATHDSHQLRVHYDISSMTAQTAAVEKILKQFPFKRFMMTQLRNLGAIHYIGALDVFWKRETFGGRVLTRHGNVDFNMTVDGLNKYMFGNIKAPSIEVGQVLGMPEIGDAGLSADFKFDISGERTAAIRRGRGGKLPIGEVTAHVDKAAYKILSVSNVDVHMESDGVTATGSLVAPRRFMDVGCSFTFTDTDNLHKLKVSPDLSFHGSRKPKPGENVAKENDLKRKAKASKK